MKYITTAVLSLGAGALLGLTEAQAAPRRHALAAVPDRKGWYTATGPVQFKIGEEVSYEGDLPKALANQLDWEDKQAGKAAGSGETKAKRRARENAELNARTDAGPDSNDAAGGSSAQAPAGGQPE